MECEDHGSVTSDVTEPRVRFLCPYYKHDAKTYSSSPSCAGRGWLDISRLKEHLHRYHNRPKHYCVRDREIFQDDCKLRRHLQNDQCSPINHKTIDGFTQAQEQLLKQRFSHRDGSDEDKWRHIFQILFPNDHVPATPYDSSSVNTISASTVLALPEELRGALDSDEHRAAFGNIIQGWGLFNDQHVIDDLVNKLIQESMVRLRLVISRYQQTSAPGLPSLNPYRLVEAEINQLAECEPSPPRSLYPTQSVSAYAQPPIQNPLAWTLAHVPVLEQTYIYPMQPLLTQADPQLEGSLPEVLIPALASDDANCGNWDSGNFMSMRPQLGLANGGLPLFRPMGQSNPLPLGQNFAKYTCAKENAETNTMSVGEGGSQDGGQFGDVGLDVGLESSFPFESQRW